MGNPMKAAARRAGLPLRCAATSRQTQEQCKNAPIKGGTVCRFHGGAAPQTKKKAALRLAALVDPAIATLGREMVKAEKSSDRQRAANSILDRAGITRGHTAELDTARTLLLERLLELRAGGPAALSAPEPVELVAEVVDDAPPKTTRAPRNTPARKPRTKKEPS